MRIDMTGWIMKEHGRPDSKITVIKENKEYKQKFYPNSRETFWDCVCECGNTMTISGIRIRNYSKSCLTCSNWRYIDMTGWVMKEHGVLDSKLTVVEKDWNKIKEKKNKLIYWRCICECGKETVVDSQSLRNGNTLSCGCLHKTNTRAINIAGQTFGKLKALEPTSRRSKNGGVMWLCQCSCGRQVEVELNSLRRKHTLSCGCLVSKGEEKIIKLLNENHIPYEKEKSFDDCINEKTGYCLRFDFYVKNDFIIEFDGEQHYKEILGSWGEDISFSERQNRDKKKNDYCFRNKIPIKRIPYWALDSLSIDDLLSDKFLVKESENNGNGLIYNS